MRRLMLVGCTALIGLASTGCVDPSMSDEGSADPDGDAGSPEEQRLLVDTTVENGRISPFIYGVNPHSGYRCNDTENRFGACRLGGNRWTAYNWENNLSNAGRDWCYQNDEHLGGIDDPPGSAATGLFDEAAAAGAALMLTVPIVDSLAGVPTAGGGPPDCGGDVRNQPGFPDSVMVRNEPRRPGAAPLEPDLSDGVVYQDEFVALVRDQAGDVPVIFSLDNEPDLWEFTHPEVHPGSVTYAELVQKSVDYATAIRETWPEAEIAGLAGGGYMAVLNLQNAPDSNANGTFVDYFLSELAAADADTGLRMLDYLDVHWYPEINVNGERLTTRDTSEEMIEARLQAPRSLWDPRYFEQSWLTDVFGGPMYLLPWLNERIAQNYPGTRLAVTEWHYGAGQHISGGVATADVLGIFGREGVGLATIWPHSSDEPYVKAAYRIYRNYDGQGSGFGDVSVKATASDNSVAAVYGSLDSSDPDRVVVVVINRSATVENATIEITHPVELRQASVFTLTEDGGPDLVPAAPLEATDAGMFEYAMPPRSASVLELAP